MNCYIPNLKYRPNSCVDAFVNLAQLLTTRLSYLYNLFIYAANTSTFNLFANGVTNGSSVCGWLVCCRLEQVLPTREDWGNREQDGFIIDTHYSEDVSQTHVNVVLVTSVVTIQIKHIKPETIIISTICNKVYLN